MAKKGSGMTCDWCGPRWVTWVALIVGVLWLLQDYNVALNWWTVGPWTAVFILLSLGALAKQ